MIVFRRSIQIGSLFLFLVFLAAAGNFSGSDLFLRMDPALVGITAIAGRVIKWAFFPALLVLLSAPLFGRVFCGYICPMGTTIDLADARIAPKKPVPPRWIRPNLKIYLLAFSIGAALLGVSLAFWTAPLALITRFYGMVVYPVVLLFSDAALTVIQPIADRFDIRKLMFLSIEDRRYAANLFVLLLFAEIFAAARLSPRFWCRYICPAGAILALFSVKPLVRRRVGEDCNGCGKCARVCPMGAIDADDPVRVRYADCLACRTCEASCPQEAIRFSTEHRGAAGVPVSTDRRRVLVSGLGGAIVAAVGLTGLMAATSDKAEGEVCDPRLIRPPGALPEPDFLSACVRCGQCMAGCPTNTLQPVWFAAGPLGMFSPAVTPRRRYCDPKCTTCGDACPTGAIRRLNSRDRVWARVGTAIIHRQKCLAWEYRKSCMVCDEVCPYDAVKFEKQLELPFPVPHVDEDKCAGCGYCEHFCPVRNEAAIVVTPMNALRLGGGSYEETAKSRGYRLRLRTEKSHVANTPGYPGDDGTPASSGGLAPGFDEGL